jgi:hypothetical protein
MFHLNHVESGTKTTAHQRLHLQSSKKQSLLLRPRVIPFCQNILIPSHDSNYDNPKAATILGNGIKVSASPA